MNGTCRNFLNTGMALLASVATLAAASLPSPACAATAAAQDLKVTKMYNPSPPNQWMGDSIYYKYSASWTSPGLKCEANIWEAFTSFPWIGSQVYTATHFGSVSNQTGTTTWSHPIGRYKMIVEVKATTYPFTVAATDSKEASAP